MRHTGIRITLAGCLCAGMVAGFAGDAAAQTSRETLPNYTLIPQSFNFNPNADLQKARFLAASSSAWQVSPQDQSMPPYRPANPEPANPQEPKNPSGQSFPKPSPEPIPQDAYGPYGQGRPLSGMDQAMPPYRIVDTSALGGNLGSTYIPLDSWIYPALMRLYSLGYLTTAFVDMRPWTRISVLRMLYTEQERIHMEPNNRTARAIWSAVLDELEPDMANAHGWGVHGGIESVYERATGISGTPLRDSFHLGQTIINDYGRPYEEGFNNYAGFSARATSGPFGFYFRGEYQHVPSAAGYSPELAQTLANIEDVPNVPQDTIPAGPIAGLNQFRLIEANVSVTLWNHDISFGKSDVWDGPAKGGAFDWSNNAENIYSFRINRVEPLHIPLLSYVLGPVRYEFLVGSLQGHTYPNSPWVHMEKFAFNPSQNFEFGFSRTVIWGGKDHVPITMGSFWHSFTSFQNVSFDEKFSRDDPGARFSTFDFTYRLPFVRRRLTLYTDAESHDDVTPVSAPRRAGIRAGLYLDRIPGAPKFDLRAEGVYTDVPVRNSVNGSFMYIETVQRQGYTNKGNIFGDWIGRESKGGQAWLTYHLSPQEMVQVSYRNAKAAKDFIPGGTTQNLFGVKAVKRLGPQVEINAGLQYERWKAPVYKSGGQSNVVTSFQIAWYPLHKNQ